MKKVIYLNGDWVTEDEAKVSIFDRGFMFGDGVYEVIPVYQSKLFAVDAHLARLRSSLQSVDITLPFASAFFLDLLKETVKRSNGRNGIIYLQISRGVQTPRNHEYPASIKPTVLTTFSEKELVAVDEIKSISVEISEDYRWERGDIKSTSLLANVMLKNQARKRGYDDAILSRKVA